MANSNNSETAGSNNNHCLFEIREDFAKLQQEQMRVQQFTNDDARAKYAAETIAYFREQADTNLGRMVDLVYRACDCRARSLEELEAKAFLLWEFVRDEDADVPTYIARSLCNDLCGFDIKSET